MDEVTCVAPLGGGSVRDYVALAEIELCGELIIAASAAQGRLSLESIDKVLKVAEVCTEPGIGSIGSLRSRP
ncbi:hypothetical protein DIZ27_16590 [Streptomyces sp. NWU339]|uniref:hypothetical protein n=1 Tax=Streptomyces sp. NWU339 TaxID=2185284 RepID=UPI000D681EC7|nr:hypothetical protein [Streptomyces sp. NWU339]PWI09328.1 hypothetical protein DIZ27_16590 [Streptomyces sp. NWU339]